MSLLDDLREAAKTLDAQDEPSTGELQDIVGALIQHLDKNGKPDEPSSEEEASAPAPAADDTLSDAELEARLSDTQAQLDARRATAQQTTVEPEAV